MTTLDSQHSVAVIGAGPAGLFAARELAGAGLNVALINRDVKPGGLAEYGIYPNKYKMKGGLRKQFRQVMAEPGLHYFGNVSVGQEADLSLDDLRQMGFSAVVVTVGAQGTKWLGLPGEELQGVYHAKDLVYHYNQLPPFSQQEYAIGKRVILIGLGNVMLDIAHWAVRTLKVDQVTAVARRGPAEVKFTKKEWMYVAQNLDMDAFETEFSTCVPTLEKVGQDFDKARAFILDPIAKSQEPNSDTKFGFDFLANPSKVVGENGQVTALEVEETTLEPRDGGGTSAVKTGVTRQIPADTVVFCIGDRVDQDFGLPLDKWKEFAKHPRPKFPIDDVSYEAYDPEKDEGVEGIFLAGWAREASSGLVGTARKDGTTGAKAAMSYMETLDGGAADAIANLENKLAALSKPIVRTADWQRLDEIEVTKAEELGQEEFKFASNEDMFAAMEMLAEEA
ncbi:MAG: FAD-dependent oxidoreductase [Chloroflexi bacterium]|nr:FAD-dependent oxidoreductase [Chloroflexota bacterium]